MTDLGEILGVQQGVISRNCKALSKYGHEAEGKRAVKGHDLVYMTPDIWEARKYRVHLTARGEQVRAQLMQILTGNKEGNHAATATA